MLAVFTGSRAHSFPETDDRLQTHIVALKATVRCETVFAVTHDTLRRGLFIVDSPTSSPSSPSSTPTT